VTRMGQKRYPYRILVGKPLGKRPVGTPGRRWESKTEVVPVYCGIQAGKWVTVAR
jgi:hypothetical protein